MHNLVIYIGTSARDLVQYRALINSINVYNVDNIPIYTAVNDNDFELFTQTFSDTGVTFIKDSDIYTTNQTNSWWKQQLMKMNFWRLGVAKHVIQVDSDSFFIKNFRISDFMVTEDVPYTILHENKELKQFFAKNNKDNSLQNSGGDYWVSQGFAVNGMNIRKVFGTEYVTAQYDYGHPPCIWSNAVWEMLYKQYVEPNNLKYEDLIEYANSEQQWYGEMLMATHLFPIYPKENMFKTFHYETNYEEFKNTDKLSSIIYNYHGLCVQSNWCKIGSPAFYEIYSYFFDKNLHPIKKEQ